MVIKAKQLTLTVFNKETKEVSNITKLVEKNMTNAEAIKMLNLSPSEKLIDKQIETVEVVISIGELQDLFNSQKAKQTELFTEENGGNE